MWVYRQSSGFLWKESKSYGPGYSGHGGGKNDTAAQYTKDVGPIPVGLYYIGTPYDTDEQGPFVLPLSPSAGTELRGRAGFLIHGDSTTHPGEASKGCIILNREIRQMIWDSMDHWIQVVP